MKKSGMIAIYTMMSAIIVGLLVTVVVLAASTQYVGTNVSILYVASEIGGSVTATYQVGSNGAKNMTDSNSNPTISFGSDQPTSILLLSPNETLTPSTNEDVLLTYTFNNAGETYYASVSYADTDESSPSTNLNFQYKTSTASGYSNKSSVVEVPSYGSATYIVKISVANIYSNASLSGRITWTLTKEQPTEQEKVTLSVSGNTGDTCAVTTSSFTYVTNEDETKFKIVGAVPTPTTTTTNNYVNGSFNTRSSTASTDSAYMSVSQLTNSSGAEFYYFCTNPEVVGNTSYGYIDPGTIYYTSTEGTNLETWYDIPTEPINLYACFMTPNFTGAEVDSDNCYNGTATQIVISNSVENIPYRTFYEKSTITNVAIPQSVKVIGSGTSNTSYGAFQGCSALARIDLPSSVTSIGEMAFAYCNSLASITIPNSVTSIGVAAFGECSSLTSITISDSVTSIEHSTFAYCNSLASITIPSSVTCIDTFAFIKCSGLTSITIPESVTSIGGGAFCDCTSLASVTIGSGVTSIGEGAFSGCSDLTNVIFANTSTTWKIAYSSTVEEPAYSPTDASTNATYLKSTYADYYWTRNS